MRILLVRPSLDLAAIVPYAEIEMLPLVTPMRLLRIPKPFDHRDVLYEVKHDGFRALAYIDGHQSQLVSRNKHVFTSWPYLCEELAHAVKCRNAVLDGEIVCLDGRGRSVFNRLLFRREWAFFYAFDLLWLDGRDLRSSPLIERKRILKRLMPDVRSRVLFVESIAQHGNDLFRAACAEDLEGIVAKWTHGSYQTGARTSWLKIKNPRYSQLEGRRDLFSDRSVSGHRVSTAVTLSLR